MTDLSTNRGSSFAHAEQHVDPQCRRALDAKRRDASVPPERVIVECNEFITHAFEGLAFDRDRVKREGELTRRISGWCLDEYYRRPCERPIPHVSSSGGVDRRRAARRELALLACRDETRS